jgi:hypothetical protein
MSIFSSLQHGHLTGQGQRSLWEFVGKSSIGRVGGHGRARIKSEIGQNRSRRAPRKQVATQVRARFKEAALQYKIHMPYTVSVDIYIISISSAAALFMQCETFN